MRKASTLALSLFACMSCKAARPTTTLQETVPAPTFSSRCEAATPDSEASITYKALMDLTSTRNCRDAEVKLRDISFLVLNEKNIKDLAPLADLDHVQWLHLYGNRIEDITPLKSLKRLKDLVLDNNQVSDISALKELVTIQELYVGRNRITSIEPIAALKKLYILNLSGNQINDVRFLSGLSALMVLDLKNNPISEHKTSSNCPTSEGISQVLRDFCSQ